MLPRSALPLMLLLMVCPCFVPAVLDTCSVGAAAGGASLRVLLPPPGIHLKAVCWQTFFFMLKVRSLC